jgi:hypothetical protein
MMEDADEGREELKCPSSNHEFGVPALSRAASRVSGSFGSSGALPLRPGDVVFLVFPCAGGDGTKGCVG